MPGATAAELSTVLARDDDLAGLAARCVEVARSRPDGERWRADASGPSLQRFELRVGTPDDAAMVATATRRSAEHFAGWGGGPASTQEDWRAMLARAEGTETRRLLAFLDGALIGGIGIQNIVRGQGQYFTLGYYAFASHAGRGLMRRAVALGVDLAFDEMGLHRAEAGIMPHNVRSLALVEALGFRFEGLMRRCVEIEGTFRDHELWATDVDEWPGATALFPA